MKVNPVYCHINPKVNSKKNLPSLQSKSYNPSFSSISLYGINAIKEGQDGRKSYVPASFSRISPEDHCDYFTMVELGNRLVQGDRYGAQICFNFRNKPPKEVNFFAIETEERGVPQKDKIISLAQVNIYDNRLQNPYYPNKHYMEIALIQSMKNIPCSRFSDVKGGGELCLYGLVRLAKERNLDYVVLSSTNNAFYDHLEFGEKYNFCNSTMFKLHKESYDEFLAKIEKKYGFRS